MPSLAPRIPLTCLSIRVRSLQLDLDVDASRQVESHERVDRLRGRVDDVDQTLVRAHLEVLARVLVLVRRTDHAETVDLRGQRHRASDLRPGTRHRLDDLPRRGVDDLVVIGLEPDADLLFRHGGFCFLLSMPLRAKAVALACPQDPGSCDVRPPRSGVSRSGIKLRPRYLERSCPQGILRGGILDPSGSGMPAVTENYA